MWFALLAFIAAGLLTLGGAVPWRRATRRLRTFH